MAYRRNSGRSRRSSRSNGGRRSYSRQRAGRRAGRGGRRAAPQQTVRIVLENPASNPMMTVPVGMKVDTTKPRKAAF